MPTRIDTLTAYALTVDFFQFNVAPSTVRSLASDPTPVDLVALTYRNARPTYEAGGFTLTKVHCNASGYHLRLDITHGGQLLAYMLTHPTKSYGPLKHLRPVHVHNEAFYGMTFAKLLPAFLEAFGLEMANVTRLDIALDTQQRHPALLIKSYLNQPDRYVSVARKPVTFKGTTYFGHGSKKVVLTMYNKTAELQRKQKPYVTAWHEKNGFGAAAYAPAKRVYRAEVSIKANAWKEYRPCAMTEDGEKVSAYRAQLRALPARKVTDVTAHHLELERLANPAYLATLFAYFCPVDIREKKHKTTRASNATPVRLIDYAIYGNAHLNTTVTTRLARPKSRTQLVADQKRTLRELILLYRDTGENTHLASAILAADHHRLQPYLGEITGELLPGKTSPLRVHASGFPFRDHPAAGPSPIAISS